MPVDNKLSQAEYDYQAALINYLLDEIEPYPQLGKFEINEFESAKLEVETQWAGDEISGYNICVAGSLKTGREIRIESSHDLNTLVLLLCTEYYRSTI